MFTIIAYFSLHKKYFVNYLKIDTNSKSCLRDAADGSFRDERLTIPIITISIRIINKMRSVSHPGAQIQLYKSTKPPTWLSIGCIPY